MKTILSLLSVSLLAVGCATPSAPIADSNTYRLEPVQPRMRAMAASSSALSVDNIIPANYEMRLTWTLNDPIQLVDKYKLYVGDTNAPGATVAIVTNTPPISLREFMLTQPNGVYRLELTAENTAGLESQRSSPLWMFWYGHPTVPEGMGIEFIPPPPPLPPLQN